MILEVDQAVAGQVAWTGAADLSIAIRAIRVTELAPAVALAVTLPRGITGVFVRRPAPAPHTVRRAPVTAVHSGTAHKITHECAPELSAGLLRRAFEARRGYLPSIATGPNRYITTGTVQIAKLAVTVTPVPCTVPIRIAVVFSERSGIAPVAFRLATVRTSVDRSTGYVITHIRAVGIKAGLFCDRFDAFRVRLGRAAASACRRRAAVHVIPLTPAVAFPVTVPSRIAVVVGRRANPAKFARLRHVVTRAPATAGRVVPLINATVGLAGGRCHTVGTCHIRAAACACNGGAAAILYTAHACHVAELAPTVALTIIKPAYRAVVLKLGSAMAPVAFPVTGSQGRFRRDGLRVRRSTSDQESTKHGKAKDGTKDKRSHECSSPIQHPQDECPAVGEASGHHSCYGSCVSSHCSQVTPPTRRVGRCTNG